MSTTIFIADDHPLLLMGLKEYLHQYDFNIVGTATNGISAYHSIIKLKPDIAILDIEMPDLNGIEIAEKIKNNQVEVKLIFITIHREPSIINKALQLGVKGYLLKEYALEEIKKCIEQVVLNHTFFGRDLNFSQENAVDGNPIDRLSPSERKILRLIAQEKNTKLISTLLFISEKTVEKHRSNIIRKLDLPQTKNSLLMWALQHKEDLLS